MLDRKLLRDLLALAGPATAIALVLASGVAMFVLALSTLDSLYLTRETYYRQARFADVFASLKRAPENLSAQIARLPGVREADTRVRAAALLDLPGFSDPVNALVLSLPEAGDDLNRLYLRAGRLPERAGEAAVIESFASAHRLKPGDHLDATLNGRRQRLTITAVALSAEFVYLIRPGDLFPDLRRYAVLWMPRDPLASAQGMTGAFNDVVLQLAPGSPPVATIAALDRLLAPYGGQGAIARKDQISHHYLDEELKQLRAQAEVIPVVFLAVAVFLLNVVIARLIQQERTQIALLRAFGYGTGAVTLHYLKLAAVIVLAGTLLGVAAGARLGAGLARMYADFFRFPFLNYILAPHLVAQAFAISLLAALPVVLLALRRTLRLTPAQGLQPEAPPMFRRGLVNLAGLGRLLSPPARMILRNLARRPYKSALSLLGLALACAILGVGGFMEDAVHYMLEVQFQLAHRADLTIGFAEARPAAVAHELAALPGVRSLEPFRAVPARLRHGAASWQLAIQGLETAPRLHRLLDQGLRAQTLPPQGLVISDYLAGRLAVRPGDLLEVEILEGSRPRREVPLVATVNDFAGVGAYMSRPALQRLLREEPLISGVFMDVDRDRLPELYARLREAPAVLGIMDRAVARRSFEETMGNNLLIFATVNLVLAATIAVGVVYNSLRIALAERHHELASLRVLGFRTGEVAYVLLGETILLTLLAIPLGNLIAYGFCAWIADRLASDLYRVPVVLEPATYAFSASVVLAAVAVSSGLMYRQLMHLDLVSALKARAS